MSSLTNQQKATYALLADNVYWDVRYGFNNDDPNNPDFTNSNWTPVPEGWTVIDEVYSSTQYPELNEEYKGFTARAYQKQGTNEVVISFAGTEPEDVGGDWLYGNIASGIGKATATDNKAHLTQAAVFYHQVKEAHSNAEITFTGHSLGGGLASVMGVWFDRPAYGFDPAQFKQSAINDGYFDIPPDKIYQLLNVLGLLLPEGLFREVAVLFRDLVVIGTTVGPSSLLTAREAVEELVENGVFSSMDESFANYHTSMFEQRANNVNATAVKGEILETVLKLALDPVVENKHLIAGETSMNTEFNENTFQAFISKLEEKSDGSFEDLPPEEARKIILEVISEILPEIDQVLADATAKHSQTLLVASLLNDNFEQYTSVHDDNNANIDTLKFILDPELYNYSLTYKEEESIGQNFLTKLVRDDVGGKDFINGDTEGTPVAATGMMLKDFSLNLKIFADELKGIEDNDFRKLGHDALIVNAIEWYYHQDLNIYSLRYQGFISSSDRQGNLFDHMIQFTTAIGENIIPEGEESKVGEYNQKWITEAYLQADAGITYKGEGIEFDQWNVALNNSNGAALDSSKTQILITFTETGTTFIAGEMDDLLIGNDGSDSLTAGMGNDTLIGGKGNDTLIGGTGFDTYIIEDFDTIIDTDGQGEIQIAGKSDIPLLQIIDSNIWEANAEDGTHYTAYKNADDLILFVLQNYKVTSTLIKDYFKVATVTDTSITSLNLELVNDDSIITIDHESAPLIAHLDYGAIIYSSGADGITNITGSNKSDILFASVGENLITNADLLMGNDIAYGGVNADNIYGNTGNDVLYGSAPYLADSPLSEQPAKDHDTLKGGTGTDLIAGYAGDDILISEEQYSHVSEESLDAIGDWVVGGRGRDSIYGSQSQDFLQGGQDKDIIMGGAGNDVILGDGNLLFATDTQTIQGNHTPAYTTQEPVYHYYPYFHITYQPVYHPAVYETIEKSYSYANDNWQVSNQNSHTSIHPDSFEWNITIDTNTGDYVLESVLTPINLEHIVPADLLESVGQTDYLYAGAGDDLVIGQYDDDYLWGEAGDDILWGDDNRELTISGNDWLNGGIGNDTIHGGMGDDILIAGLGRDILDGGEGYDVYSFELEELSDDNTNTIIDSDKQGVILIDQINWAAKTWRPIIEGVEQPTWEDGLGNFVTQIGEDYRISSDNFTSQIVIKGNTDEQPLGLRLNIANTAPELGEPIPNQLINADESFSIVLSDDLFIDANGDELTYSLTLVDGDPLPDWLSFNDTTNTLSGTPPQGTDITINLIATDPLGETIEQSFNIRSNARPIVNEAIQPILYIEATDSDWQYALPDNTFIDGDGDALTYTIEMVNGSNIPTGINIDALTGTITADATLLATDDTNAYYDINVVATDSNGAQISSQTQLYISEVVFESDSGFISGIIGDEVIIGSLQDTHRIYGLIGDDIIYGGNKIDTLNGNSGEDTLYGRAGEDKLNGGLGNDTLLGGKDNDTLKGGLGDDSYIFNKGDGQDTIRDFSGDNDTLILSQFSLEDLVVESQGNSLVIEFNAQDVNNSDSVIIENWNAPIIGNGYHIETVQLANTIITDDQLTAMIG